MSALPYRDDDTTNPAVLIMNEALASMDRAADMAIDFKFTEHLRRRIERIVAAIDAAEKTGKPVEPEDTDDAHDALMMTVVLGRLKNYGKFNLSPVERKAYTIAMRWMRGKMRQRKTDGAVQLTLNLEAA